MHFSTNKISTSKGVSFEDYISKLQANKVKTASQNGLVKVAESDEGPSSGQLDVEPLHQEGESVKPVGGGSGKKKKKKKEEGESSGQLDGEPNHQKGESVDKKASKDDCDEDEENCEDEDVTTAGEDCMADEDEENCDKEEKTASEDDDDCDEDDEDCDDDDSDKPFPGAAKPFGKKEDKEASSGKFVKIANLDSENRKKLSTYFKNIYPSDFVEALLQDK